jgi:hypothetical protein
MISIRRIYSSTLLLCVAAIYASPTRSGEEIQAATDREISELPFPSDDDANLPDPLFDDQFELPDFLSDDFFSTKTSDFGIDERPSAEEAWSQVDCVSFGSDSSSPGMFDFLLSHLFEFQS